MKKYTIFADTHFYSYPSYRLNISDLLKEKDNQDCILLGDIIDIKNSSNKREHRQSYDKAYRAFKTLMYTFGKRYITGNHELSVENRTLVKDGILFTHGDKESWGIERSYDARSEEHGGKGLFTRVFKKIVFRLPRPIFFSEEFVNECIKSCVLHNVKTIVIGHRHPIRVRTHEQNGFKIVVVPRGKSVIEL